MIRHVILSEQVKETLLDDILSGRYRPGDRLVESQIARSMGISQSPVREALRDLMAMRFVEVVPHKGARVRKITRREVLEIYPVRAALEELAGNLAAQNVSEHLGELEESIARMTEAFDAGDHRQMVKWDVRFHRTILEATGNQVLIEAWNSLMIEARTFVTLRNLMATQPNLDLAARHRPIIDALREGDPKHTGAVMRSHVEEFGAVMHDIFKNEVPDDFGEEGLSAEATEQPHHVRGRA